MITQVFAIHDAKANEFLNLVPSATIGTAIRSFEASCKDEKSDFSRFPEDYAMFHLGEYDSSKGVLTSLLAPLCVSKALDFKKKNN